MNKKITKTISTTLLSFFIILIIYMIFFDIDLSNLLTTISIPLGLALGNTFHNIFEYEKFDEINIKDFLSSNHTITIPNTDDNWNELIKIIHLQFKPVRLKYKEDNLLVYSIPGTILDSILSFEKNGSKISIVIKKQFITFLPNRAKNYQVISLLNKKFNKS